MQVRKLQQANADQAATIKKQQLLIVDLVEVLQADDDDITLIYDDRRGQLKINRKAPKPPCAYR
jgi:hypothetical protein